MYASYFGLRQEPFSIAPDPRYLYMSERHREALAHLLYGLGGGGGFVLLTGEIGTGKTTVCRSFLEQIPANCNVAYIFNPKLTVPELLQTICEEFHIPPLPAGGGQPSIKAAIDALNAFLLREHAAGRNNVLIIDEAQNLSADVLEQLRLLTNLETSERKLLQIILIGQPELRDMVAGPGLEQLGQRVIARYHLGPLHEEETAQYVAHRLEIAGLSRPLPFDRRSIRRIHRLCGGIPRRVNLLCDRSLLGAYARGADRVTPAIVDQAAREVYGPRATTRSWTRQPWAWLGGGAIAAAVVAAVAMVPALRGGAGAMFAFTAVASDSGADASAASGGASAAADAAVTAASAASAAVEPASAAVQPASAIAAAQPEMAASAAKPVLLRDSDAAWRSLAGAWGVQLDESAAPCRALAAEGIQCSFNRSLGLPLIRQLNRPGVVTLDARTGAPSYALLVALGPRSATLRAGGTEQTVTLQALATRWQGEFGTLWRAPEGARADAVPRGAALEWVATQLADGDPAEGAQLARSLPSLRARLRTFQLAQGLPVTGTLNALTYMQLNRLAAVDEPQLRPLP